MSAAKTSSGFTSDEIRRLSWDAATLSERLDAAHSLEAPAFKRVEEGDEAPLVRRWRRLLAPDDPAALTRRLSWDGIDVAAVSSAVSASAPLGREGEWTAWIPRVLEEAPGSLREFERSPRRERRRSGEAPQPPFRDIWVSWIRAGRKALLERTSRCDIPVEGGALVDLEGELLHELSRTGELLLFEEWKAFRSGKTRSGDSLYREFVTRVLESGLANLMLRHPLWARDLSRRLEAWTLSSAEMLLRLDADRRAIEARFGGSLDRVARLEAGLSDPHEGGRRVCILAFASGLRLVYKPRDVALEEAFHGFLRWVGTKGLTEAPPALKILARPGYGWVEWASQGSFESRESVETFYRRAGSLLCVGFVLGGRDWHQENVFATSQGPLIVDAEMLVGPRTTPTETEEHDDPDGPQKGRSGESCLETGLLGWSHVDARGRLFEAGGLQPAAPRGRTLPARRWSGIDTDDLDFTPEEAFVPQVSNRVVRQGEILRPEHFGEQVIQGFSSAYEFLVRHRDELLSASGPVEAFSGLSTRVLFRSSDQYGALLELLSSPSRQGEGGIGRSVALETLNAIFARDRERPLLWPLVEDEREALERLDIPRFALPTNGTAVRSRRGHEVTGHFKVSGLDSVRGRLKAMSGRDLERQRALVSAALEAPFASPQGIGSRLERDGPLVPAATVLGLAVREHLGDGGLLGHPFTDSFDLYQGHVGIAVFLSALGAVAGREWADLARFEVRRLSQRIASSPAPALVGPSLGACDGLGSLVYGLTACARLSGEASALEAAVRLARHLETARIEEDTVLDVEGGVAGMLLALLALHAATGESGFLTLAEACGRRLLSTQKSASAPLEGAAWPGRDGSMHAGFAHGAAGIASGLGRLHARTGDPSLAQALLEAHRYERSLYSPAKGNWPHLRPRGGTLWLMAWCHGAPGIALGRLLEGPIAEKRSGLGDMAVGARATMMARPSRHDHLCCGSMGQADVLLSVGRATKNRDLEEQAQERLGAVARRVLTEGWRGVRSTGFEQHAFEPGLFRGISGVGYELLRGARPDRLPSILGFEALP